jgi:CHAT domain-containing protein/Flp pilus assembly protein TadD
LEVDAKGLVTACPDSWAPAWAVGECRLLQKDLKGAAASFDEGLSRARRGSDDTGTMLLEIEVGRRLWKGSQRLKDAEPLFVDAGVLARKLGRPEIGASAANNLAGILFQTGRFAEAARLIDEALSLAASDDRRLVSMRYNQALLIQMLGNREAARGGFRELHEEAPDAPTRAKCAMRLGVLAAQEGSWEEAKRLFDEARAVLPAQVDLNQGFAQLENGSVEEARDLLDRAAATLDDPLDALVARIHLGQAELRLGHTDRAEELAVRSVRESDDRNTGDPRWRARLVLGRVRLARRDLQGAIEAFRDAVEVIRRQGAALRQADVGLRYLVRRSEPFAELAAALAAGSGDASGPEILTLLDESHARALQEGLREQAALPAPGILELERTLPRGRVVIGFLLGEDRGTGIAVAEGVTMVRLVPGLHDLRDSLRSYRAALEAPLRSSEARLNPRSSFARGRRAGEALYAGLLAPFEPLLGRAQRIDFVLDADLALIPPATFPIPESSPLRGRGAFLGDVAETVLVPLPGISSATNTGGRPVLLAGDPEPDPGAGFPLLPRAAQELDSIAAIWQPAPIERLQGPDLRRSRLDALGLGRFGLIHFATHAVASSRDPSQCAVILSKGERLALDQILEERLDGPLVVLSACRTGEGEMLKGEGVVGLSWAFLRAGASGVVVSFFDVDDDSASRLMQAFHRHLRASGDPVASLCAARREIEATSPHPAYWAPFELILHP